MGLRLENWENVLEVERRNEIDKDLKNLMKD
jgi:hypothetical protein